MFETLGTPVLAAIFCASALAIVLGGTRMSGLADRLADRTGIGEAVAGAVLLGIATSLSGTVASVSAAAGGHASLAVSNAVGGIAAQSLFLVIADLTYRKANLEHAAADANNLIQAALLVVMLSLPLAAFFAPPFSLLGVHPVSIVLIAVYLFFLRQTMRVSEAPMWRPARTEHTRIDLPETEAPGSASTAVLVMRFAALMGFVGVAGWSIAGSGVVLAGRIGMSETVLGALFIATITSMPELVTTLAAVRRGALQLAVGGIIGGNSFDVLFLSLSDVAYREGSIYHAMEGRDALLIVAGIAITGTLLLGLLMRDRKGVGFEGLSIIVLYALTVGIQIALG